MTETVLARALAKGRDCERLRREEALAVASVDTPDALHRLGEAALANRRKRFDDVATFIVNLHINPSNICEGGCRFCRYSARPQDEHAYVLEEDEILGRVAEAEPSEVHIVGGMNRIWDYQRSLRLVREIRRRHPHIFIKGFTAVEVDWFARCEHREVNDILAELKVAGVEGLPGGGAEMFSPRMRKLYCPDKLSPDAWLAVHKAAHGMGFVTNATMLYGLGETAEERVEHLLTLRRAQDESGGFGCFIPLAFQPGDADAWEAGRSPLDNLVLIALARLVLDNFPHIKAYWPMIGTETAAAGLSWGADDLDGTLGRERIAQAAGTQAPRALTRGRMVETIRLGGFDAVERDGRFNTTIAQGQDRTGL